MKLSNAVKQRRHREKMKPFLDLAKVLMATRSELADLIVRLKSHRDFVDDLILFSESLFKGD